MTQQEDRKARKQAQIQAEKKEKRRLYLDEYNSRPEVIARKKAYRKIYDQKPENVEKRRQKAQTKEGKEKQSIAHQKWKMKKFQAYLKAEGLTYEEYKEKRLKELEVLKDF